MKAFQNKIDPALLEERSKNQREEKKRPVEFFFEVIADSKRDSMIRAMSAFIAARTCEERNMQEVLFNYHISEDSNTLLFDKLILICRDDHGPNQGWG